MIRVNIGCGGTPTKGWFNFDNSFSILLSKFSFIIFLLDKNRIFREHIQFIKFCHDAKIKRLDAAKKLPFRSASIEVIYSSHMIEHLDKDVARKFLKECYRCLSTNGIIRIVVPDLRKIVNQYIIDGDADSFLKSTLLIMPRLRTLIDKIKFLAFGFRKHNWMYDEESLCKLLSEIGFINTNVLPPGITTIVEPGELNLFEREDGSIFIEAVKP